MTITITQISHALNNDNEIKSVHVYHHFRAFFKGKKGWMGKDPKKKATPSGLPVIPLGPSMTKGKSAKGIVIPKENAREERKNKK